jgi:hypothetical protein
MLPSVLKEETAMKATLPDGIVLDGTLEEVTHAVRAIQAKATATPLAAAIANIHKAIGNSDEQHSAAIWTMKRADALWNCLYGHQKKLVKFLLDKGGTASVPDITKHLGLKGTHLAGVRSCITRNARRETSYKEAVVIKWTSGEDGKWYYQLVPEVHDFLKQIANKAETS